MRSIIFTSLIAMALPAQAQEVLSCYARTYSEAHLASHPDQVVKGMVLAFHEYEGDTLAFAMTRLSRQGRAAGTLSEGRFYHQYLYCGDGDGAVGTRCGVDCDGGGFEVTKRSADSITLRVNYMIMGDPNEGCGGTFDIVEKIGTPVFYRLDRVDPALCEAVIP